MRRPLLLALLGLLLLVGLVRPVAAATIGQAPGSTLPGTNLEADERDDGSTSAAKWYIGSGIAAALFIGVGGGIASARMKDKQDR